MSKIKKYLQELDRTPVLNAVFMLSMICIVLVYIFSAIYGLKEIIGYENFDKVVNAISGLATALTLAFVVYQHKDNDSKSYQLAMVEEAKLVVDKIIEQLEKLYEWDGKEISILDGTLIELANHAFDFDIFYNEVKDSALKKIILIRWQDMFLNHFQGLSKGIDICSIIRENTADKGNEFEFKIINLKEEAEKASQGKRNEKYEYELYCLSKAKANGLYDILSQLECQDGFKYYFFNNKRIKKYLEGVNFESVPRETDPTLCAIIEASIIS